MRGVDRGLGDLVVDGWLRFEFLWNLDRVLLDGVLGLLLGFGCIVEM